MARNRIIYASQSVVCDGDFLYRVQTLGSTTTFASTDLFELGQQDIIDVVDDVPTVAITLDTNDWGSPRTAACLSAVSTAAWDTTATNGNANLVSVSGTTEISHYHGVSLSNYGVTGSEFDMWAPVQTEGSLGTADDNIDQTVFMARSFVTGITMNYTVGGEATENFTAESDNKTWFLNDGRFVSQEEWDATGGESSFVLSIDEGAGTPEVVQTLSDSTLGFLHIDPSTGRHSILRISSLGVKTYYPVVAGAATATEAGYASGTNTITLPTATTLAAGDLLKIRYSANAYAVNGTSGGDATRTKGNYFTAATDAATGDHSNVGGLRQGQIEIYLVDPDASSQYDVALRLQTVNVSATLNREALSELGHLKPYDRPVTFPIEITTSVETTAGDLETFAKFAGKAAGFDANTTIDLTIDHLLAKDNLILVIKVFDQTDVEAGGIGALREVLRADMVGKAYWNGGVRSTYALNDPEFPLKTIVVPNLKATNEAYNLSVGANATQTFTFRSVNKLFMVKGEIPFADLLLSPGLQVNS